MMTRKGGGQARPRDAVHCIDAGTYNRFRGTGQPWVGPAMTKE
jgi:hypothetical protein